MSTENGNSIITSPLPPPPNVLSMMKGENHTFLYPSIQFTHHPLVNWGCQCTLVVSVCACTHEYKLHPLMFCHCYLHSSYLKNSPDIFIWSVACETGVPCHILFLTQICGVTTKPGLWTGLTSGLTSGLDWTLDWAITLPKTSAC